MRNYIAENVDDYIASADVIAHPHLTKLREIVKETIPEAEESISWGVPFYRYYGLLGGFSVFKNHVTFGLAFVLDSKIREILEDSGYATGSKTIQIKFNQDIPVEIIRQILLTRAKENRHKKTQVPRT